MSGAVMPPHSKPVSPIPPGRPAAILTGRSSSEPQIFKKVFITAGAQCPIFSRFPRLRVRQASFFREVRVANPARRSVSNAGDKSFAIVYSLVRLQIAADPAAVVLILLAEHPAEAFFLGQDDPVMDDRQAHAGKKNDGVQCI